MILNMEKIEDTKKAAEIIAALLKPGDLIALYGDMGIGKTTLISYIAKALNCKEEASSPTFAIAQRYEGDKSIWHLDLYRLEEEDLYDIGYEDYFYPEDEITFIEWPERAGNLLPEEALVFTIKNDNGRYIHIDKRLEDR